MSESQSARFAAAGELAWHTLGADRVLRSEGVDGQRGLSAAEAAARARRRLTANSGSGTRPRTSGWGGRACG